MPFLYIIKNVINHNIMMYLFTFSTAKLQRKYQTDKRNA